MNKNIKIITETFFSKLLVFPFTSKKGYVVSYLKNKNRGCRRNVSRIQPSQAGVTKTELDVAKTAIWVSVAPGVGGIGQQLWGAGGIRR